MYSASVEYIFMKKIITNYTDIKQLNTNPIFENNCNQVIKH